MPSMVQSSEPLRKPGRAHAVRANVNKSELRDLLDIARMATRFGVVCDARGATAPPAGPQAGIGRAHVRLRAMQPACAATQC